MRHKVHIDLALDGPALGVVLASERVRGGAPGCRVFVGPVFDARGSVAQLARAAHDELRFCETLDNVALGVMDAVGGDEGCK